MPQRWFRAMILGAFVCVATASPVHPQTTVNAGSTEALPGSTAAVPIRIVLQPATSCATLQLNLTVVPGAGAPTLDTAVTFVSLVGPPGQNAKVGKATALVGWFSSFDPLLMGTAPLGTLNVKIPASAQAGHTYAVTLINPSGTIDGATELPMTGVNGSIIVAAISTSTPTATATPTASAIPTPTATATLTPTATFTATSTNTPLATFLVCDVSPSTGNAAGEFGDGAITNADVVALFKASLLGPPPADSARFAASDPVPEDVPPTCGGDGKIQNSDVVACFKRSLIPTEPRYLRMLSGGSCTSAPQTAGRN